jgi:hypothetical protein
VRYHISIKDDDPEKSAKLEKVKAYCEEIKVKFEMPTKLLSYKRSREIDLEKLRQLMGEHLSLSSIAKEMDISKSILTRMALEHLAGIAPTPSPDPEVKKDNVGWVEME